MMLLVENSDNRELGIVCYKKREIYALLVWFLTPPG
jgi:hypothetical protein